MSHQLRQPSEKQITLALSLGLDVRGKSFRVLSAEITDALELKAFTTIDNLKLHPADSVNYIGPREDMPRRLTVSTIAKNGFIHFRKTSKYCRPWDLQVASQPSNPALNSDARTARAG